MTTPAPQQSNATSPLMLWLPGAVVGGGLVGVVAGLTELVPEPARAPALIGAAAAVLLGFPGVFLKLRAARQPLEAASAGPLTGGIAAVQIAVLTDFVLNTLAVGTGLVGMWVTGMKFNAIAGFGLAYATAALAIQVLSGVGLARTLRSSGVPVGGPGAALPAAGRVAEGTSRTDSSTQPSVPGGSASPGSDPST